MNKKLEWFTFLHGKWIHFLNQQDFGDFQGFPWVLKKRLVFSPPGTKALFILVPLAIQLGSVPTHTHPTHTYTQGHWLTFTSMVQYVSYETMILSIEYIIPQYVADLCNTKHIVTDVLVVKYAM